MPKRKSIGPAAKTKGDPASMAPAVIKSNVLGTERTYRIKFNTFSLSVFEKETDQKFNRFIAEMNSQGSAKAKNIGVTDLTAMLLGGLEGYRFEQVMKEAKDARPNEFTFMEACAIADGMGGIFNCVDGIMEAFGGAFPDAAHSDEEPEPEEPGEDKEKADKDPTD